MNPNPKSTEAAAPGHRVRRRGRVPAVAAAVVLLVSGAVVAQNAMAGPADSAAPAAKTRIGKAFTDPSADAPDLGPNVDVFDPSMSKDDIQGRLDEVFKQQETNQFGEERHAELFKPGSYDANANVGFYTEVAGLGLSRTTRTSTAPCTPRPTGSRRRTPPRTSGVTRRIWR